MEKPDFKLEHDCWVLVADGQKALILTNEGDERFLNLKVVRELEQENPPTREQGTDRPGRFNDGGGAHRSAVAETDWHQLAEERFAKDAADLLYRNVHRGDFKQVVLVAAPEVLGEIRKNLHKEVAAKVVGEIPKTLTNHPIGEIEKHLGSR
ncbi:host attachment family protein [Cucumibacter marinus]|uniref:host attachment family protein n=1 Tax=Cucumibacter marinus TaxID=1121252 RepID=UPI00041CB425|nr:host attachment family protein [Cucumibacter marinus]